MKSNKSNGFIFDVIGVGVFIVLIFVFLFSLFPSLFYYLIPTRWFERERVYPEVTVQEETEILESLTPEEEERARRRQEEREQAQQQIDQRKMEELEAMLKAERESEQASREQAEAINNNSWDLGDDSNTVEGAFGALYREIFEPAGDTYECRFNAKGNWYIVLSPGSIVPQGETEARETVRTLVYDRESKNGECHLIVYYEEIQNENGIAETTAIRNTYAIKKSDGTVIPSGKHAWADVGNSLYQEATGEK